MSKIIWKGIIKSEEDFPTADIPKTAVLLDDKNMKTVMLSSIPFMFLLLIPCFVCVFAKAFTSGEPPINPPFIIIGVLIGFLLMLVHEYLHAIAYPRDAEVWIGIMPKSFAALVLSSSPISKTRFIFMSLLPIILGVIPMTAFCMMDSSLKELNSILLGAGIMGMTSVYPDIYNVTCVLKKVPKGAILQNNKNHTFYYFGG